jgi:magnesium-transporting ATPase (P-type)
LRRTRTETKAKRLQAANSDSFEQVDATTLMPGDLVLVEAGDFIPSDGEVIQGVASVDESAITGESAPVIRESGGGRSAVTGGTRRFDLRPKNDCRRRDRVDLPRGGRVIRIRDCGLKALWISVAGAASLTIALDQSSASSVVYHGPLPRRKQSMELPLQITFRHMDTSDAVAGSHT